MENKCNLLRAVDVSGQISLFNYRPQRSWAKVIFSEACVKNSVHRGGCSRFCSNFWGGAPDFALILGGCSRFCSNFSGGGSSKFSGGGVFFGGVPPNFQGGVFFGGGSSKFSGGGYFGGGGFSTGIRSTFGRYASYWNAFLFAFVLVHPFFQLKF